jgi:hypothetical protein
MDEPAKGPGIRKVNTRILEDNNVASQIGNEIEEMMKQADNNWNPHMTLEFMKVTIRSIFSTKVAEIRKKENNELQEKEEEMNQFENLKTKSSRCDTGLMHDLQLTWASGESETKGKGGKKSWSNLML